MVRTLTADEVEFTVECHPEDISVKGNASAIDDETDAETERGIRDQLEAGNGWAWCQVRVVAKWNGFEGDDWLGGCSYLSEQDFLAGGYFEDMKEAALSHLNEVIAQTANTLEQLSE
jgi:hypothetical protein